MPTPSKNYAGRYSVPVSPACQAMIEAELKYIEEQTTGGNKKPTGQLLGEMIEDGIRARMKARGVEPPQMPAVLPGDAADPEPIKPATSILRSEDLIALGEKPEVQDAVNREGSGRAA